MLRGRAANPRWIAGQMRHGHRGAAEIAETLDNLFAFAALTDAVDSRQFDLMFDATLGDDAGARVSSRAPIRQAASGMAGPSRRRRRRGFWFSRRNSSAPILASVVEERGMSAIAPRRKGWCPGALCGRCRPGDGLARAGARVRADDCRSLRPRRWRSARSTAATARSASLRAAICNLRGVERTNAARLHARLADVALIDADPEIERLRNIVASPLDDVDPDALLDLGPSVAALETRLGSGRVSARVAGQVRLCVRCVGGALPLGDVEADVRFEAAGEDAVRFFSPARMRSRRNALPARPGKSRRGSARAFVRLTGEGEGAPRRMRALLERRGAGACVFRGRPRAKPRRRSMRRIALRDLLGVQDLAGASLSAPRRRLARSRPVDFSSLIERARTLGASGLRLTPWRSFLIVGLDEKNAGAMLGSIAELGFVASRGRAALAHRRLSGRARLHAWTSGGARGRRALGGAHPQGRGDRSACQRLRQGVRQGDCDGSDPDGDRVGLRSYSRRQGRRPARAPRPSEHEGRGVPWRRGR